MFQLEASKFRFPVETVPSAVLELLIGMSTGRIGASSSTTVKLSEPPASVVTRPLLGATVIPGASVCAHFASAESLSGLPADLGEVPFDAASRIQLPPLPVVSVEA